MLVDLSGTRVAGSGYVPASSFNLDDEESLYQLAKMQGGIIADQADELKDPTTGILSTVGHGFKNAFKWFIDTISIPSNIVAGAISDRYTVGQAIEQHIQPSDVIMPKTTGIINPNETTMQKIGGFTVRLGTDVLLDPLTYVTFGLGGAAKNTVVRVASTEAANTIINTARAEAVAKGLIGEAQESFVQKAIQEAGITDDMLGAVRTLNDEGQKLLNARLEMTKAGQDYTIIKNTAIDLVNKSAKGNNGIPTLSIDEAISIAKKNQADGYYQGLIKATVDANLDRDNAIKAMSSLLAKKPGLQEDFLAKGGINFFGKTLLSSQRISSVLSHMPGMTVIDELTQPIRNHISTMFNSQKFQTSKVAYAPEMARVMQKWTDFAIARKNEVLREIPALFSKLGITRQEADFLTAAVEANLPPSDPKLLDLWNGIMGLDSKQIPENIVQGIRAINGINKRNLREAWAAGIRVSQREGYMSHLVKTELEESKNMFFGGSPTVNLKSAKQAQVAKFVNVRNQDEKLVGIAESLHLKPIYVQDETQKIKEGLEVFAEKAGTRVEELTKETVDLTEKVQELFVKNMQDKFVEVIARNMGEKQAQSMGAALAVLKELAPRIDVKKMTELRAEAVRLAKESEAELVSRTPDEVIASLREAAKRFEQNSGNIAENINKSLLEYDPSELEKLVVSKNGVEGFSEEMAATLDSMKQSYKQIQKETMERLIDKDELSRFMQSFADHYIENPTGVRKMLDGILGRQSKVANIMKELELFKEKQLAKAKELEGLGYAPGLYKNERGEIFRRHRASIAEAEAEGFVFEKNSLAIMLHSSLNTVKATSMKHMIDDLVSYAGKPASEAPSGWREISVSGAKEEQVNLSRFLTSKKGEPIVFHPEVAKQIENFNNTVINDEEMSTVLRAFDTLTNIFKASVTSIFIPFHGRNAISNVFQNYLDIGAASLNPVNHVMSARIVAAGNKIDSLKEKILAGDRKAAGELAREIAKPVFTDRLGKTWYMGELHRVLKDYRIGFSDSFSGKIDTVTGTQKSVVAGISDELFGPEVPEGLLKKGAGKATKVIAMPFKGGRRLGNIIEDQARILNFVDNMKKTGDIQMAASRTKMFLFDYNNLTPFEKTVMRRLIPFYTWIRKNLELQARVLLTNPGRISQQVKFVNSLSNGELSDEEYDALPDYMKAQYVLIQERNGKKTRVLSGFSTPLEAAFSLLDPNQALATTNPFLRLPVELMTGYDTFRGGLIDGHANAKILRGAPQWVKDMAGYTAYSYKTKDGKWHTTEVALNPKMWHFMSNIPLGSRLFNEIYKSNIREDDYLSGKISLADLIRATLTGVDPKDIDFDELSERAKKDRVKAYQDMLEKAGVIYKFNKDVISKNRKEGVVEQK